jgi:hypothetical protein
VFFVGRIPSLEHLPNLFRKRGVGMKVSVAISVVFGVVISCTVANAAVVELRAVRVNDVSITPTTTPIVGAGDVVEVELILLPGFGAQLPDGIRGYEIVLAARRGVESGTCGLVLPLGWDAPLDPQTCIEEAECEASYSCVFGWCRGADHNPCDGAWINQTLPDWLFFGSEIITEFPCQGFGTLDYRFSVSTPSVQGSLDDGSEFYLGTLVLVVQPEALGTFTFDLVRSGLGRISELVGPDNLTTIVPESHPLQVTVLYDGAYPLTASPPQCAIDAGLPHARLGPSVSFGFQGVQLRFDSNTDELDRTDFAVFTTPPALPPVIEGFDSPSSGTIDIVFDRPIDTERWTCVRHVDTGRVFCIASLPGDVNQDRVVGADDVAAQVEGLRNGGSLSRFAHDTDRSGAFTSLDILTTVDVLVGADAFRTWEGAELDFACPGLRQAVCKP